jgi:hypothetical protein
MNGKKLTLGERKLKKRGLRLIQGRRTPQPVLRPGGDPLEAFALFTAVTILSTFACIEILREID